MSDLIKIHNAVLHILDNTGNVFVPSDKELEADLETSEFLSKHIEKLMNDSNIKNAVFSECSNNMSEACRHLADNEGDFLPVSVYTAERLFEIMTENVDIAPADLICCLFEYAGQPCYGILKLNYKTGFTHFVQPAEEGNTNTLIRYKTILPSESQKIEECAFINLNDLNIKLIEKAYEIRGEKDYYFSKILLNCTTDLSDSEKLKIIDKAAEKMNKKFYDDDFDRAARLKKAVAESIEETGAIEVSAIVRDVFDNNVEIQNEYIEEIRKAGLKEESIPVPEKLAEKKFKSMKILTDTGIEISLPPSFYNNKDKVEFINNPDGTISILIKNVGTISNR